MRDLASFADVERLLAADVVRQRLSLDVADDDDGDDEPPASMRRWRLLGRNQKVACEGRGKHLALTAGIR